MPKEYRKLLIPLVKLNNALLLTWNMVIYDYSLAALLEHVKLQFTCFPFFAEKLFNKLGPASKPLRTAEYGIRNIKK